VCLIANEGLDSMGVCLGVREYAGECESTLESMGVCSVALEYVR
jgi:hypothetical protein